jgi:hypothetical protein
MNTAYCIDVDSIRDENALLSHGDLKVWIVCCLRSNVSRSKIGRCHQYVCLRRDQPAIGITLLLEHRM